MKSRLIGAAGFLAGLAVLYLIPFGLDQLTTGRIFLAWPNGSIWSNMAASLWWLLIAGWCTWYLRDHIGKRLTAWMSKHHPHTAMIAEMKAEIAQACEHAKAARTIAGDHYRKTHGEAHPLGPPSS